MKDKTKGILMVTLIVLVVCMGLFLVIIESIEEVKDEAIIREHAKELCLEKDGISDIRVGYNYCIINNTKYEIKGEVRYGELKYVYLDEPKKGFFA